MVFQPPNHSPLRITSLLPSGFQEEYLLVVSDLPEAFCSSCPHIFTSWVLTGFSRQVLLKLFSYCVKVKVNRQQLVKLEMNTLNVMLGTLNLVSKECGLQKVES